MAGDLRAAVLAVLPALPVFWTALGLGVPVERTRATNNSSCAASWADRALLAQPERH
jgi:hypothetical protein